ncbi:hypothetical protein E3N88_42339 [Mikania micrantha]|uniref:Uncharacterized protein n=1 Tax=Mikania micrantha TaxID=192012 RepID=A0A5N6LI38_9ASTR|nr:hypothetical protein E3N88_42339 [Mikania micrantha]
MDQPSWANLKPKGVYVPCPDRNGKIEGKGGFVFAMVTNMAQHTSALKANCEFCCWAMTKRESAKAIIFDWSSWS